MLRTEQLIKQRLMELKLNYDLNLISPLFGNDAEYQNMFGICQDGLNSINEASYMSSTYGYIRALHVAIFESSPYLRTFPCPVEIANKAIFDFIKDHGDYELYSHYLKPESEIKLPKFGADHFQYAADVELSCD